MQEEIRKILTVIDVSPRIMSLDGVARAIEDSEAVDDVRAEFGVDVFGKELALALPVPGPVGEVADDLVLIGILSLNAGKGSMFFRWICIWTPFELLVVAWWLDRCQRQKNIIIDLFTEYYQQT